MANMKKYLLMGLCIVLTAVIAVSGTLAYLMDTDSDVNVMQVGSVKIDQLEWERDDNGDLVEFTQDKPAIPAVYKTITWDEDLVYVGGDGSIGYKVFNDNMRNVLDKIVTVNNTGKSDAYVRTVVAIEAPDFDPDDLIHINYNGTDCEISAPVKATIAGTDYVIFSFTYKEALAAGAESAPSLMQLFLDKKATNDYAEQLGDTWSVLVVSQAVQADGFDSATAALDEAFGKIDASNNPWVTTVSTAAALNDALENARPNTNVQLAAADYGFVDIDADVKDVTIVGEAGANVRFNVTSGADLENVTVSGFDTSFVDSTSSFVDGGFVNIDAGAKVKNLVIEDSTFNISGGRSSVVGVSEPSAEITVKNCDVTGPKYLVYGSAPIAKLTVEGNDLADISSWIILGNAGDAVGAQLTFKNNVLDNCTGGIAKYLGSSQPAGASTVFEGNDLTNCKGHDGSDAKWFTIPGATATITVADNTLDGAAWTPGVAQGLGK